MISTTNSYVTPSAPLAVQVNVVPVSVDAGSALMIMTLGAGNGDAVTVESEDQGAVDTIAGLVAKDLDA